MTTEELTSAAAVHTKLQEALSEAREARVISFELAQQLLKRRSDVVQQLLSSAVCGA